MQPSSKSPHDKQHRKQRLLYIRNWLNGVFIFLSIVAIIGVLFFKSEVYNPYFYGIAIVAVWVKLVELLFRIPFLFKH